MPEGTLRFGVVVGPRHTRLVLATMSTVNSGCRGEGGTSACYCFGWKFDFVKCLSGQDSFLVMFIFEQKKQKN